MRTDPDSPVQPWLPFAYRDFHDVPRAVLIQYMDESYYLLSRFDDVIDEYSSFYEIFLLDKTGCEQSQAASWIGLEAHGRSVGKVSVSEVEFDATRRKLVNTGFMCKLSAA